VDLKLLYKIKPLLCKMEGKKSTVHGPCPNSLLFNPFQ
jgi:hypothetical protein